MNLSFFICSHLPQLLNLTKIVIIITTEVVIVITIIIVIMVESIKLVINFVIKVKDCTNPVN